SHNPGRPGVSDERCVARLAHQQHADQADCRRNRYITADPRQPPVVPPPPETRPAPPTAPPMPFTFVGEQDAKAARPRVFLSNGDQLLIVSPGDVIDRQYRVESVSESSVVLTYLPLNQVQVVSIPVEGK
ncbi:hypothetical protein, partial [Burkholderia sp. Ap-955]|uniref:hypothetical protein n=1 Tax=Burkholderia sp. Ap-955 TaxID=2608332 RepID=UPI001F047A11